MASGDLERSLQLTRSAEHEWAVRADPNYESGNGLFGGWTTAVVLRAVCAEADGDATPAAITVNFVSLIEPGAALLIRTRRVGGGRSVSYWQAEVVGPDGVTWATASAVLTVRRDTDAHLDLEMPDAPDPETVALSNPAPGPHGERTPVRQVIGAVPHDGKSTYSLGWVRETSGRTVDHFQLG